MTGERLPVADWPLILYGKDVEACLGIGRIDAATILKKAPVLDPSKRRYRAITKRDLLNYLKGEENG